jgi:hypothetical protein
MTSPCIKILKELQLLTMDYSHDNLTLGTHFSKVLRKLEAGNCDQYLGGQVKKLRTVWHESLAIAEQELFPYTKPDPQAMDETLVKCRGLNNCSTSIHYVGCNATERLKWRISDITKPSNLLYLQYVCPLKETINSYISPED